METIHEATEFFQHLDQRRGGGYAMQTATTFLTEEVAPALKRASSSNALHSDLFSAAGELVYVVGWSSFDANHHAPAQEYFQLALTLATEAGNRALEGHILRAMAHQALDLNQYHQAAELAEASVHPDRYSAATPRERALLGVVHARTLAHSGDPTRSSQALLRAEDDLAAATSVDEEPQRVWFFQEASLAHETARTLHVLGDLEGAQEQFHRSVLTRHTRPFGRTHAVTLGYLGEVQAQQGDIDKACATWTQALEAMHGVRSGRARNTVTNMRRVVHELRGRGTRAADDLYERLALTSGALP
ncbi:hypothetical protein [Nocardiopsis metallicus]|uniref:Tetratricopeptide (TPR) repeat protein n=1 Tax=Nocardiopsis metallicus TaxID=179819 RepID=A0A840WFA0_9ACTN|nr:hypothetical protein [Nocardiopsis metallicus]MBB5494784.1 tetratricopeptide (TPR) repeat protein [Nocardiopsis metallicus]